MRFTAMPNAVEGKGIWAASGVNAANVGMTATETITSNPRVLGADPLVEYRPAKGGQPEVPGGIGEEDIVYLVLPYIHTAREGVQRLGQLLQTYGTYEMNGIAFADVNEVWWLETIGGHHWIARRVPDDVYVVMPNQLGLDRRPGRAEGIHVLGRPCRVHRKEPSGPVAGWGTEPPRCLWQPRRLGPCV